MTVMNQIRNAWSEAEAQYERGLVSSEATLQATLFASMLRAIEGCEVHCQVRCLEGSHPSHFPDLLVVRGAVVLAVLELKFSPEGTPKADRISDDLCKLARYAALDAPFWCRMNPRTGRYDGEAVSFSDETLYVFGIVAPEHSRTRCIAAIDQQSTLQVELLFMPSLE